MTGIGKQGMRLATAALAVAALAACGVETRTVSLDPPSPDLMSAGEAVDLGGTAFVSRRHGFVAGGAGEGAAAGFATGLSGGANTGYHHHHGAAQGNLVGALAIGIVGGIVGAAVARPAEETFAAERAMAAIYADASLLEQLPKAVHLAAARLPGDRPVFCLDRGPGDVGDTSGVEACAGSDLRPELRFESAYSFVTLGSLDPDLVWFMDVTLTAYRPDGPRETHRWAYRSPQLNFFAMAANDGAAMRSEIEIVQKRVASQIVDDLLRRPGPVLITGTYRPDASGPNFAPNPPPVGTVGRLPPKEMLVALDLGPDEGKPVRLSAFQSGGAPKPGAVAPVARAPAAGTPPPARVVPAAVKAEMPKDSVRVAVQLGWARESFRGTCDALGTIGPLDLVPGGPAVDAISAGESVTLPFRVSVEGSASSPRVVLVPLKGTFGARRASVRAGANSASTRIKVSSKVICGELLATVESR